MRKARLPGAPSTSNSDLWQLPDEFLRERVERARLLAADEGDGTDLQHFLEDMDATVAFHRTFLNSGPAGPTVQQAEQGIITFLYGAMHKLLQCFHITIMHTSCGEAMEKEALRMQASGTPALGFLGGLAIAAIGCLECPEQLAQAPPSLIAMLTVESWGADVASAAAALEQRQLSAGCAPMLTAQQLRLLASLLRLHVSKQLHPHLTPADLAAEPNAAGLAATRQLVLLQPDNASLLAAHASQLSARPTAQAAAAHRAALAAARREGAHSVAATAALSLAYNLVMGAEGGWSLAEVHALLEETKREQVLCRRWLPKPGVQSLKRETVMTAGLAGLSAALHPGQDRMPPALGAEEIEEAPVAAPSFNAQLLACDSCGNERLQLKKCSKCRSVAYCSRECQLQAWRQGGHKRVCAALARAASQQMGQA